MKELQTTVFREMLDAALIGIAALRNEEPEDKMLNSIELQLRFVQDWIASGANPDAPRVDKLNFGLMAAHSVADLDTDLTRLLHEIAGQIDDALEKVRE